MNPKNVAELFKEDSAVLFTGAGAIAGKRSLILCSPAVITGECTTTPVCRHCKWEYLKWQNPLFHRRRTREEMVARAKELEELGIHRAFLPSGWMGYRIPEYFCEYVRAVKDNCRLEIYSLMGALDKESLAALKDAGLDGCLCGLESPNERIYRQFRPGGDSLAERLETIVNAKALGLKVWSGFLVGLGETEADIIKGLTLLHELDVDSVSILPFTPYPNTAMERENPANPYTWARVMAIARLFLKKPDFFSDFTDGFYGEYGKLGGANGFYVFPGSGLIGI